MGSYGVLGGIGDGFLWQLFPNQENLNGWFWFANVLLCLGGLSGGGRRQVDDRVVFLPMMSFGATTSTYK